MSVEPFPKSSRKRTVPEALADMAAESGVEKVLILGDRGNGITIMSSEMTLAEANLILDRAKQTLLGD